MKSIITVPSKHEVILTQVREQHITPELLVTVEIEGDRFVIRSESGAMHSLDINNTDADRLAAHVAGFIQVGGYKEIAERKKADKRKRAAAQRRYDRLADPLATLDENGHPYWCHPAHADLVELTLTPQQAEMFRDLVSDYEWEFTCSWGPGERPYSDGNRFVLVSGLAEFLKEQIESGLPESDLPYRSLRSFFRRGLSLCDHRLWYFRLQKPWGGSDLSQSALSILRKLTEAIALAKADRELLAGQAI